MKSLPATLLLLLLSGSVFAGMLPSAGSGGASLPGSGGSAALPGSSGGSASLPTSGGSASLPSPPKSGGGDAFVSATILSGDSVRDIANNSRATLETGEPVHGGTSGVVGGKSLWWKWRASVTGTLVISTAGSSIDTLVGVYTGDSVESLTRLGADNDSGADATSLLTIEVVTGSTYHIAVDGYNGEGGDIILKLDAVSYPTTSDGRPYNDDFENAAILSGSYATSIGFTDEATNGTNDLFGDSYSDNRSIWWQWTAPANGRVNMTTDGSSFSTYLAVLADLGDGFGDRFVATNSGGLTSNVSKVSFDVVKGVTYYILVDGGVIYIPGGFARGTALISIDLVPTTEVVIGKLTITRPVNDQFEFRTGVKSNSYSQSATNKNATVAVDEPLHAGSNSASTVWWTWTAPNVVGKLTLTAASSDPTDTIKPVIAAYTGATINALTPIASATDVNGVTKLVFNVEPGTVYQIAVCGGLLDDSGPFDFTLEYTDGRPAFASHPVSVNALSGSTVVFSAPATEATLTPYIHQWQRLVGKTWTNIVNGATYTGATTDTLTVNNVTLGNTGSQFRCLLYNVLSVATSSVGTLIVVPNPPTDLSALLTIKVGTLVNRTVAVVNPNFAIKYYASGLPKGLKINASTGQITGTLTAAAGSYTVKYWTQSGKLKSAVLTTVIVVPPYPAALTGGFEALLTDGSDIPVGKLQVTIGSTGLYTGKLTTGAAAVNVLKGSLVVAADDLSATSTLAIKRKGFPNSQLAFTIRDTGTIDATLVAGATTEGTAVNGVKVATSSISWAGTYTLAFTAPTLINGDNRPIPAGSGYASVNIASNGVMTIAGKNADGTPLTASLASDSAASYRLYAKPNANIGSYVAGWFTLSQRSTGGYHVDADNDDDIYWGLAVSTKNTAYKDGFGPLALTARMEPWANLFAPYQVSLADDGLFGVDIFGAGITNGGSNTNNLPTALQLALGGQIGLTAPNLSGWSLNLNKSTGVFTGSFTVTETLTRKVPFGGVLLQLPDAGVFGQGYFLLPSTAKKGPSQSGGLEFIAPAPAP